MQVVRCTQLKIYVKVRKAQNRFIQQKGFRDLLVIHGNLVPFRD